MVLRSKTLLVNMVVLVIGLGVGLFLGSGRLTWHREGRAISKPAPVATFVPTVRLLEVKQALVAENIAQRDGVISVERMLDNVSPDQPFGLVFTLAPKQPLKRDLTFQYQVTLSDPEGCLVSASAVMVGTLTTQDVTGKSYASQFELHDGVPLGPYRLAVVIDGQEIVARIVTLHE